ncbi:TraB/GumN family protein [Pseudoflavitalea sp. G-6-1-2]|uniref:TraB/GumN family protein n=1 Tax=Pseudoflavitalea sp. G-6-1-2 TaxID=2728841 RepID=UPI001469FBFF|nr:TraB/GumN family protein [Pseudoflavitalea sp. G-6-1-2]NML22823.1 TraB/GumN family protein [Pseudoflavitalea sp. G-6-1-2]
MKRILYVPLLCMLLSSQLIGQSGKPTSTKPVSKPATAIGFAAGKKYPSLLWEISGNGLKKSSWLFGTMHVSNKLAFKLGDPFYNAIRSADVVALETNPETWQDDYSRSAEYRGSYSSDPDLMPSRFSYSSYGMPRQNMSITSFAIDSYEELARASLAIEPSLINGMLYRTYGSATNDFEENTFLDMHIFQVGRKLGKRVSGVENFEESERLVAEAYHDASKDKNKKKKSYSYDGVFQSPKKLEDAYRDGDLDLLDSIEMQNVQSDAFQEKFMFRRNEIQAKSIDSIIRKASLFVGVGAAHLPGNRGVIELLRKMGYTLRPVNMGARSSEQKEQLEKMRVEHSFQQQTSSDGFYKVSIPGKKFYEFGKTGGINVVQFADLVNGAYYLVTRVKTNSSVWGDDLTKTAEKIDAGLYENVPGKIIKKTAITKNGYPGFDVTTRTRRGDLQRYQVFVTPFEMIFFKMSGNGDYVGTGTDASKFFSSISFKEYIPTPEWSTWQPATGGFSVLMPYAPSMLKDEMWGNNRLEYAATEKNGNSYLVMKGNLQNYTAFAEDSFELNLMDESYQYSGFIEKQTSRKLGSLKGYPMLDATYNHKDGSHSTARFLIQGPNYYVVLARYKQETPAVKKFINSFSITPFIYPAATVQTDTAMHYTVKSPVPLNHIDSASAAMRAFLQNLKKDEEDDPDSEGLNFSSSFIGNDTLGEKIFVNWMQISRKSYSKDSIDLAKKIAGERIDDDSMLIYRSRSFKRLPNGADQYDFTISDTGSSRMVISRMVYRDGHLFSLSALTDTITRKSALLENFFDTFTPADTLKASAFLNKMAGEYVNELFSKDSVIAKRGAKKIQQAEFDSTDVPLLKRSIEAINWNVRNYLSNKEYFIGELGKLKDPSITGYLTDLYWKVKDTSDLQRAILEALLDQKTAASFKSFKDLILQEPPILEISSTDYSRQVRRVTRGFEPPVITGGVADYEFSEDFSSSGGTWSQLYDTLALTKTLFPDMLQFLNIDDFKSETLDLLHTLIDSGYLKGADYESQLSKLYLDGRMLLKKQIAKENKVKMAKVAKKDMSTLYSNNSDDDEKEDEDLNNGNIAVDQYSVLLLPFRDKHPGIQNYFKQLMTTTDTRLLYNSFILLLRNNQPVADSLFTKFASSDKYRYEFYTDLKKIKKLDKFPDAEKKPELLARSFLLDQLGSYSKPDTLVYLKALAATHKQKESFIYFFKYKKMRDDDNWALATCGIQSANKDSLVISRSGFTKVAGRTLENDKPEGEQLEKIKREMVITTNPIAYSFYEARQFANYKSMLSEMVKRRRYQD